tara:strand:- start:45 stop:674 length:630 start_codon:yes stop_codon:yes gene_type:complete
MAITINSSRDNADDKTVFFTITHGGKDYKWHGDIPKDADAQAYLDAKSDTLKAEILRNQYRDAEVPQLDGKSALESFEAWVSAGAENAEVSETQVKVHAVTAKDAVTSERQQTTTKSVEEEVSTTEIVKEGGKYVEKTTTETVTKQVVEGVTEEVDLYNEAGEKIGKHTVPVMESYEVSPAVEAVDEVTEKVVVKAAETISKKSWVDTH